MVHVITIDQEKSISARAATIRQPFLLPGKPFTPPITLDAFTRF